MAGILGAIPEERRAWYKVFHHWLIIKNGPIYWLDDIGEWVMGASFVEHTNPNAPPIPRYYKRLPSGYPFLFEELDAWLQELVEDGEELPFAAPSSYHVHQASQWILTQGAFSRTDEFQSPTLVFEDGYWLPDEKIFLPNLLITEELSAKTFFAFPFKWEEIQDKPTPLWDSMRERYDIQIFWVEQFFLRMILGHDEDEYMLYMVGPGGTGKGTIEGFFRSNLPGWIGGVLLNSLGRRFGLQGVMGRRAVVDTDMSMAPLYDDTLSILKRLTGRDQVMGGLTIDIKGRNPIQIQQIFFFYACANLLPKLKNVSLTGWFRRIMIMEFTKPFKIRDPTFKERLAKEFPFVLWELLQLGIKPLPPKFYEEQEWGKDQQLLWQKWSDPVHIACDNLFYAEDVSSVKYEVAADAVAEELRRLSFYVPQETTLKRQITEFMRRTLGAELNGRGEDRQYDGVQFIAYRDGEEVEVCTVTRQLRHEILTATGHGMFPQDLIDAYPIEERAGVAESIEAMLIEKTLVDDHGLIRPNRRESS